MSLKNEPLNDRLNTLIRDYRQQLPQRIQLIEELFSRLLNNKNDASIRQDLYLALHKLAGSGATFGFRRMGQIARCWEHLIHDLIINSAPLTTEKCDEMHEFVKQLIEAAVTPDES